MELRAAQYVRMSNEHKQFSTLNQSDKIRDYAEKRGIEIIKTYADDGKSGLSIGGRAALLVAPVRVRLQLRLERGDLGGKPLNRSDQRRDEFGVADRQHVLAVGCGEDRSGRGADRISGAQHGHRGSGCGAVARAGGGWRFDAGGAVGSCRARRAGLPRSGRVGPLGRRGGQARDLRHPPHPCRDRLRLPRTGRAPQRSAACDGLCAIRREA